MRDGQLQLFAPGTRAVNLRTEAFDVYIGRPGHGHSGYFGNPYHVREHGAEALGKFREYFYARLEADAEFRARVRGLRVRGLRGKRLGCFCKPGPCHGDIIAAWVEQQARPEEP